MQNYNVVGNRFKWAQGCKGLHPATLLLFWLSFILLLQAHSLWVLLGLSLLGMLWLVGVAPTFSWFRTLKRLRYLLLSLILIYAFASPGVLLLPQWGRASPTWEGVQQGTAQALFLWVMILSLNILLHYVKREQLVQGLLLLLVPLGWLGVPVERFALRLSLTLSYAEKLLNHPVKSKPTLQSYLAGIFSPPNVDALQPLLLPQLPMTLCDVASWALLTFLWSIYLW